MSLNENQPAKCQLSFCLTPASWKCHHGAFYCEEHKRTINDGCTFKALPDASKAGVEEQSLGIPEAKADNVQAVPQKALLPCPFCGSAADLERGSDKKRWYAGCPKCAFYFVQATSNAKVDVTREWNQRVAPSAPADNAQAVLQNTLPFPTVPGWWWFKPHAQAIWEPIKVSHGLYVDTEDLGASQEYSEIVLASSVGGEWVGPISVPSVGRGTDEQSAPPLSKESPPAVAPSVVEGVEEKRKNLELPGGDNTNHPTGQK